MTESDYFNNQFLIAMPGVVQGEFDHSVTLLCEHSADGAMGLVINRPTPLKLCDMFTHMELQPTGNVDRNVPVYWGGPVQTERGFVLHKAEGDWDSTMKVSENIWLTSSKDILEAINDGKGPEDYLVTLGYAGWAGGQLESEILENSWLNSPSDTDIIFDTPAGSRWSAAAQLIGVDATLLSGQAGHA